MRTCSLTFQKPTIDPSKENLYYFEVLRSTVRLMMKVFILFWKSTVRSEERITMYKSCSTSLAATTSGCTVQLLTVQYLCQVLSVVCPSQTCCGRPSPFLQLSVAQKAMILLAADVRGSR